MPPKKKAAPALTKVVKSRYDLQIIDEEASSSSDTLTSDQEEKDKRVKTRKSKAVARENALPSNQVTSMENTVKHSVLEALMDPKAANSSLVILPSPTCDVFLCYDVMLEYELNEKKT